jgi:predicted TIM-barrel fold metal-dependent hydrolase
VLQGTSWADPQTDLGLCMRCNDKTAEWAAQYPNRFVGSFVLPLQDLKRSLGELERAVMKLGLRVANVGAQYGGAYLGDPVFHPFWEAIEAHGVTAWIHPEGTRDPWFQRMRCGTPRPVDRGRRSALIRSSRRRDAQVSGAGGDRTRRRYFPIPRPHKHT